MFRNYFLINLILIIMIAFLGIKFYKVTSQRVELPSLSSEKRSQTSFDVVRAAERTAVNENAYNVISDYDLFRPSRSPAQKKEVKTETMADKNPPKLFGTIILNELKSAILEDPDTKSTKNYRINDSVAGYVVSDILEDKVVLTRDGDSIEVKLRESKGVTQPTRRISGSSPQVRPAPTVNRTRPQVSRARRTRRPVPPRASRPAPNVPSPEEELPEEVENLMEHLEETQQ